MGATLTAAPIPVHTDDRNRHSAQRTMFGSIALLVIGPDGDPDVPPNGDQAADPRIYCARGGDLGVAESRDYLLREGVEVFELNVEGCRAALRR